MYTKEQLNQFQELEKLQKLNKQYIEIIGTLEKVIEALQNRQKNIDLRNSKECPLDSRGK